MDDILKECTPIINEVCEKYNYDTEDKEGNDSLRTVLLKAVPAMLDGRNEQDRQLFYQMLSHTPIVVVENLNVKGCSELKKQYFGDINSHIKEDTAGFAAYESGVAPSAYVSSAIIDENLNLIGRKKFVYTTKDEESKDFYNTNVNVSQLIHELGHAWHAELDEYTMSDDGILERRSGFVKEKTFFVKNEDGTYTEKYESVEGLFMEEAANSIEEEEAISKYLGISLDDLHQIYKQRKLERSNYQLSGMTQLFEYLLENGFRENVEKWRLYGDEKAKNDLETWIEKTTVWNKLKKGEPINDEYNYQKKREIINRMDNPTVQSFFEKNENVFFPDDSSMSPSQKIDNVLEQKYDFFCLQKGMLEPISDKDFVDLHTQMVIEGMGFVAQASEMKAKEEISKITKGVTLEEVKQVTTETKSAVEHEKNARITQEGEINEK